MQALFKHPLMPLISTSVIAGVVLTILAPLGTGNFNIGFRLLYWVGLSIAGGVGAFVFEWGARRIRSTNALFSGRRWPTALWQSIGASLCVGLFIIPASLPMPPRYILLSLFYIWVISIVICCVGALQKGPDNQSRAPSSTLTRPAIFERIKPALRSADIYALTAEDHYVRVITSAGDDLILMRLSDAIKETAPLPGLSPHRSWWVAEAGAAKVSRASGKTRITLKNDTPVPVSRNGAKAVREAGWL